MIWQFKHQNCHSFDNIGQFRIVWREKKKSIYTKFIINNKWT